jgi:hypothetical protein
MMVRTKKPLIWMRLRPNLSTVKTVSQYPGSAPALDSVSLMHRVLGIEAHQIKTIWPVAVLRKFRYRLSRLSKPIVLRSEAEEKPRP